MNHKVAKIWSANTDLPVTASCARQTVYQIAQAVKRRAFPDKTPKGEAWNERTWPSRDFVLRNQSELKNAVNEIVNSEVLEAVDALDVLKLRENVPEWLDGKNVYGLSGDFVQTLLTLGTFLKQY